MERWMAPPSTRASWSGARSMPQRLRPGRMRTRTTRRGSCRSQAVADRAITKRLAEALALVDVRLIDHFVVGDGDCVSASPSRGLL